jgi:hypothetical protein
MKKIVDREKLKSLDYSWINSYAYRRSFGNAINYSNGHSYSSRQDLGLKTTHEKKGMSDGTGHAAMTCITSIVDPVTYSPLQFYKNTDIITWDDAWKISSEDEKLILALWMPIR